MSASPAGLEAVCAARRKLQRGRHGTAGVHLRCSCAATTATGFDDDRPAYTRECVQTNHHRKTRPAAAQVSAMACVLWLSGCVEAGHVPARASSPDAPPTSVGTTAQPTTQGPQPAAPTSTPISVAPAAVAATD